MALVFELGSVGGHTCLVPNMHHPDLFYGAVKRRHAKVAATFVSLGTTVLTFALTMLGAGDAVSGLKTLGTHFSAAGSATLRRIETRRRSRFNDGNRSRVHPSLEAVAGKGFDHVTGDP